MKIKDRYQDDRPREKLLAKGASALTDTELLMAILGSGTAKSDVATLARKINNLFRSLRPKPNTDQTSEADPNQTPNHLTKPNLQKISGLGPAKTCQLLAAQEYFTRKLTNPEKPILDSPEKIYDLLKPYAAKQQEYFILLTLDGANRLINQHIITIGTLTSSLVHPREVFAPAIADRAASIIVAHNHPSGSTTPSPADREVTTRLQFVATTIGVPLLDHLILTKSAYTSII
ncbi:MAG: DNA repair protein RadC [Candidatus Nomurabacteria bacterium]|jgi:DNA repair protein RadC|nr:DNA repair protein RadC [Candidatus Nomurabacteria bacterium]